MNRAWLIARRDWIAILLSPAGLCIVATFLTLAGYFFASDMVINQEASLRYTFSTLGILSVVIVPLLTMRLLADEFRSGSFEVLITNPLSDTELVVGKFLAGWLSFFTLTLPTLTYLAVLERLGSPDWWMALNGFFGLWLLGLLLTALGLLFSATTDNSLFAALGALTAGILLHSAGDAVYALFGWPGEAIAYLSVKNHFALFRRGVLDSRSVAFFLFTTVMLLFLTVRIIESRRWKFGVTPGITKMPWRSPKQSLTGVVVAFLLVGEAAVSRLSAGFWSPGAIGMALAGIVLLGAVSWYNLPRIQCEIRLRQTSFALTVAFNCLLAALVWGMALYLSSRLYTRFDMTSAQRHTLAPLSRQLVAQLDQPVEITVCIARPEDLVQEIRDLLDEFSSLTNYLNVQYLNPQRSPEEAEYLRARYQLPSALADEVLVASGERYRRLPRSALVMTTVLHVIEGQRILAPAHFVGEAEILSALLYLTREQPGRVVFLSGHGERDPENTGEEGLSTWVWELNRKHWQIQHRIVTPGGSLQFPSDTQVVVVAGPKRPLSNEDLQALNQVLDRGGGVLFLLDPGMDTGVEPLIHAWNFRLRNDFVVDTQSHTAHGGPASLFIKRFSNHHPIGAAMGDLAAVLPTARRVAVTVSDPNPHVVTTNFMHTTGSGWALEYDPDRRFQVDPKRDRRGPISLGMAAERYQSFSEPGRNPLQGRMVVIGDSDFATNRYIDMAGNLDLALNCVEWLAGRHDLLSIHPRVSGYAGLVLTAPQAKFVYWWSILLLPGLAAGTGFLLWTRRRWQA